MKRLIVPLICVTLLLLAVPCFAFATDLPGSSAIGAFTFDLYETVDGTATGAFSETGPILTLPELVNAGTIRVWEGTSTAPGELSDKVFIYPDSTSSGVGNTIQLFSDDPSRPFPADLPNLGLADVYEGDFTTLPIIYAATGPNIYRIWSDLPSDESDVPLPPSFYLLGSSLLGLAGWRRFRKV
jgi:hypothetical protein